MLSCTTLDCFFQFSNFHVVWQLPWAVKPSWTLKEFQIVYIISQLEKETQVQSDGYIPVAELDLTKLLKFGGQSEKDGDDSDDGGGGDGDGGGGGGVLSWRNSLLWNGVHPKNWELYGSYGSYEQDLVRADWLETVSGAFAQLLHLATWLRLMWMHLKLLHTALGYLHRDMKILVRYFLS